MKPIIGNLSKDFIDSFDYIEIKLVLSEGNLNEIRQITPRDIVTTNTKQDRFLEIYIEGSHTPRTETFIQAKVKVTC